MVAMIRAFAGGDVATALARHEELLPVTRAMFIETNPIPVKTAMAEMKLPAGPLRLPLVAMGPENKAALVAVLKESGLLA
jgi:4-hydroxy-tetrahydrodipicolinate synthase